MLPSLLRSGRVRPVLLSCLLIGLPLALLFVLQLRTLGGFERSIGRVLRDVATHSADILAEQIQNDFRWPIFSLLEQINHTHVRRLRLEALAEALRQRPEHGRFVDRVFVWSEAEDADPAGMEASQGEAVFFPMQALYRSHRERDQSAEPLTFARDPALSARVLGVGRQYTVVHGNFAFAQVPCGIRSCEVVLHLIYTPSPGRQSAVALLGAVIDTDRLSRDYFPTLVSERSARHPAGLPRLAIAVLNEHHEEVFRSGPSLIENYEADRRFPFLFFDINLLPSVHPVQPELRYWTVRTGYSSADRATLVASQTGGQRRLFIFMAVVAGIGLAVTIQATVRSLRLADMKAEFIASVTHELKTPLAKIRLFADTLRAGRARTPEKAAEYCDIIIDQVQRLDRLLSAILHFRRAGAKVATDWNEVDLRPIVRAALADFSLELREDGFQVEVDLPANELPVRGDAEMLQRAFGNLIGNAIKYSNGAKFLGIRATVRDKYASVEFIDRGIGVPRAEEERIFEKFYRVRRNGGPNVTGWGLGLVIVRDVARAHRGRASVRSAPDGGSIFRLDLPLAPSPGAEEQA